MKNLASVIIAVILAVAALLFLGCSKENDSDPHYTPPSSQPKPEEPVYEWLTKIDSVAPNPLWTEQEWLQGPEYTDSWSQGSAISAMVTWVYRKSAESDSIAGVRLMISNKYYERYPDLHIISIETQAYRKSLASSSYYLYWLTRVDWSDNPRHIPMKELAYLYIPFDLYEEIYNGFTNPSTGYQINGSVTRINYSYTAETGAPNYTTETVYKSKTDGVSMWEAKGEERILRGYRVSEYGGYDTNRNGVLDSGEITEETVIKGW